MRRPGSRTRGFAEVPAPFDDAGPAVIADACALIVFHHEAGAGMSRRGREAMGGRVLISPVTVWELTRKTADGKLPPPRLSDASNWLQFLASRGFGLAPLTWEAASLANTLPLHHRDPMDRLLIATALTAGLPIITNERAFVPYGVATIW